MIGGDIPVGDLSLAFARAHSQAGRHGSRSGRRSRGEEGSTHADHLDDLAERAGSARRSRSTGFGPLAQRSPAALQERSVDVDGDATPRFGGRGTRYCWNTLVC